MSKTFPVWKISLVFQTKSFNASLRFSNQFVAWQVQQYLLCMGKLLILTGMLVERSWLWRGSADRIFSILWLLYRISSIRWGPKANRSEILDMHCTCSFLSCQLTFYECWLDVTFFKGICLWIDHDSFWSIQCSSVCVIKNGSTGDGPYRKAFLANWRWLSFLCFVRTYVDYAFFDVALRRRWYFYG